VTASNTTDDDIVTGAVTYLRAQPECVTAVDTFTIGGKPTPGIFGYRLSTVMEGSSATSVVIAHDGGWAAPNLYNTLRFPRLLLNVWADPIRDAQKNNIDPLVQRRANACFETFDKVLHRSFGEVIWFGTVRVVDCVRLTEPIMLDGGDGLIRLQAYYAVTQG
jgi:hypothetical protein